MTAISKPYSSAGAVPAGTAAFVQETAILFLRWVKKLTRRPVALYFSLIQPLVWLFLFGQMFSRLTLSVRSFRRLVR